MDHLRGRADHKHPSARIHRPQIAYEREAVPVGQPAVEERNVYASFEHRAGFGQRTRLTPPLQVRLSLQQADEGHPEVGAVVYHQDTDHLSSSGSLEQRLSRDYGLTGEEARAPLVVV